MFIELAKRSTRQDLMFMYWCVRPSGASGNPPRSTYFAGRLLQCKQERDLLAYFTSVLRVATHLQQQPLNGRQQFWHLSGLYAQDRAEWTKHQHELESTFPQHERAAADTPTSRALRVVLCIDEASTLLNHLVPELRVGQYFHLVRLAANAAGVQLVLADTQSKITNLVSGESHHISGSQRPKAEILRSIAAPWVAFNVVDFDDFADVRIPVRASMPHHLEAYHALQLGRPLWSNSLPLLNNDLLALREFAVTKLLCAADATDVLGSNFKQPQALAIVASRVVLPNISGFDYAAVVASHMATCIGTSPSRDQVYAQYLTEPILAEAAALVMHESHCHGRMHEIVEALTRAWCQAASVAGAGPRAEAITQLLSCLAKDSIVRAQDSTNMSSALFTADVSAFAFLCAMAELPFPPDLTTAAAASSSTTTATTATKRAQDTAAYFHCLNRFCNATVSFTHFTSFVESAWQPITLQRLYTRAAALLLKQGTAGSDLLVPVRFPPLSDGGTPRFGAILIQVKDYDEKTALDAYDTLAASTLAAVKEKNIPTELLTGMVYVLGGPSSKSNVVYHRFFSQVEIRNPDYACVLDLPHACKLQYLPTANADVASYWQPPTARENRGAAGAAANSARNNRRRVRLRRDPASSDAVRIGSLAQGAARYAHLYLQRLELLRTSQQQQRPSAGAGIGVGTTSTPT